MCVGCDNVINRNNSATAGGISPFGDISCGTGCRGNLNEACGSTNLLITIYEFTVSGFLRCLCAFAIVVCSLAFGGGVERSSAWRRSKLVETKIVGWQRVDEGLNDWCWRGLKCVGSKVARLFFPAEIDRYGVRAHLYHYTSKLWQVWVTRPSNFETPMALFPINPVHMTSQSAYKDVFRTDNLTYLPYTFKFNISEDMYSQCMLSPASQPRKDF